MNELTLFPRQADRAVPIITSRAFMNRYWTQENLPINSKNYNERKSLIKNKLMNLVEKYDEQKNIYANVQLIDASRSKSSNPEEIFKKTGLEIIAQPKDTVVTVTGTQQEFNNLSGLIETASLEKAKTRGGNLDTIISRELFAIQDIIDLNNSIDKRIDEKILNASAAEESFKIKIYLYDSISTQDTLTILKRLHERFPKQIAAVESNNYEILGNLSKTVIESLLLDPTFNDIQYIECLSLLELQRAIPFNNIDSAKLGKPETNQTVIVIDNGIQGELLERLVLQVHTNYPSSRTSPADHGSFVASRILFGDKISAKVESPSSTLVPLCRIIDARVYCPTESDLKSFSELDQAREIERWRKAILTMIEDMAKKYGKNTYIFNMAINNSSYNTKPIIDDFSSEIDRIQKDYNVLFIISAGNHTDYKNLERNKLDEIYLQNSFIAPPAESINAIIVGSIAEVADNNAIVKVPYLPSPFSRKGGYKDKYWLKKPDLIHSGGNIGIDSTDIYSDSHVESSNQHYGVEGLIDDQIKKASGTSYALPLVTREVVKIANYLSSSSTAQSNIDNRTNILKALSIHSTFDSIKELPHPSKLSKQLRYYYGFGIPSYENLVQDDPNRITMIHADKFIESDPKEHILKILLPDEVLNSKLKIFVTTSYNPQTFPKSPSRYGAVRINTSLKFISPDKVIKVTNSHTSFKSSYANLVHFHTPWLDTDSKILQIKFTINSTNRTNFTAYTPQPYTSVISIFTEDNIGIYEKMITLNNLLQIKEEVQIQV